MTRFAGLVEWDARLSGSARIPETSSVLRILASLFAHSGDSWFWLLGLAGLWWFGSPYWRAPAILLAIGILVTALMVMVLKLLIRRNRPAGEWGAIYRKTDPHSFPSGHAARASMLAVLILGVGPTWLGVLLAVWAPFVGLARIALGVHYLSDVLVGMALGILIALLILWLAPQGAIYG